MAKIMAGSLEHPCREVSKAFTQGNFGGFLVAEQHNEESVCEISWPTVIQLHKSNEKFR